MTEYSPDGAAAGTLGVPHPVRGATALEQRLWFLTAADAGAELGPLDPASHGLVLRGKGALPALGKMRQHLPGLPMMVEPLACSNHVATADEPLWLPGGTDGDDTLFDHDPIAMNMKAQRDAGATMAVLPTGQIRAQDSAALKSVVSAANGIDELDVLVLLVVVPQWLSDATSLRQLIAGAQRIRHTVGLGLINGRGDPLDAKGVADGYRQFFEQVPGAVPWRADLSGIGAVACGAPGMVIGTLPSLRRFAEAGKSGFASSMDRTPHLLLPDLARFARSGFMHTEWFAATDPIQCDLECCNGRALDSFTSGDAAPALKHNITALDSLARQCFARPSGTRKAWFGQYLQDAVSAHAELGNRVGKPITVPGMIGRWRTALAAA